MRRPRRNHALVVALYINAALLLAILVALAVGRADAVDVAGGVRGSAAAADRGGERHLPDAGAVRRPNTWGCYVMDVDAQTLCRLPVRPGDKNARGWSPRSFRHDRQLHDFNTDDPSPPRSPSCSRWKEAPGADNDRRRPSRDPEQEREDGAE